MTPAELQSTISKLGKDNKTQQMVFIVKVEE